MESNSNELFYDLMPKEMETFSTNKNTSAMDDRDYSDVDEVPEEALKDAHEVIMDVKYLPKHTYVVDLPPVGRPTAIIIHEKKKEEDIDELPVATTANEQFDLGSSMAIALISVVLSSSIHHIFTGLYARSL